MPEKYRQLADLLPFVSLALGRTPVATPILTRLLETAIMSAVAGGIATYIGVELLKNDVATLREAIQKVDQRIEKMDEKIERVRGDLYVPRGSER